ncbi:MAG TPA: biosynthetic-type acetolactate synthase large subunit [Bacteroidetes bacterium]|nr:biosynthetic-type acetolactate synthase large subunit [Bacteroidota bacterium]
MFRENHENKKVATASKAGCTVTGSEALMLSLLEEGVDVIYGYPGGAIMPVYDALFDYRDRIRHILVRHEQGAAHAADGYARVTGKVGVCLVTSGPGATNLITGLANAMVDSVPLVCITGQVASPLLGSDAFQETDVVGISMPVTKWNAQITSAEDVPGIIAQAFYLAKTGRPGPVLVDITKDAQFGETTWSYRKCTRLRSYFPYPKVKLNEIQEAARLINQSRKPLILAGHGVLIAGAQNHLMELATRADIPVASTLLGLSAFPSGHRLYAGMLGMHGNYAPNVKTNECDVLIAVGLRFDDRITGRLESYARQAKIIHIDIDPAEINKNVPVTLSVVADAREALSTLLSYVKENRHTGWIDTFGSFRSEEEEKVIRPGREPAGGHIRMDEVVHQVSEKTKGQAVVVTDVGQHQMVAARYYRFNRPGSFVTSGGLGTMGFGLPASIGAKIGRPDREVVLFVGDGGFQMTIQELGTIAQSNVPVKIVLLNNQFLGMVRQWQDMFFRKRYSFTELQNPDFVTLANAYGIHGERCIKREDLAEKLDSLLASEECSFLEVMVEPEHNVFPMIPAGESVSNVRLE